MRGSIPLSSAKLNNMRDIKKEMTMIKGGDFLEWYDSLDAVEKAQYKVEFNQLQKWYDNSVFKFNEILDDHKDMFIEDLLKGRMEQAIKDASEWVQDDLVECVQEAMYQHNVIPYDENDGKTDMDKLDERFDAIYKAVVRKLYTDAIHRKPDNLNTTEVG